MIRLGLSCICECVQILKVQFVVCSSLHIKQNKQVFGLNNSVFVPMTQKKYTTSGYHVFNNIHKTLYNN